MPKNEKIRKSAKNRTFLHGKAGIIPRFKLIAEQKRSKIFLIDMEANLRIIAPH